MRAQAAARVSRRTWQNLALDISILIAFLVATAPRLSGLAIHEWLSIAFGGAIIVHMLIHWQWIAAVTARLLGQVGWSARGSYLLNVLLFIAITVVIVTGVLISEEALPLFGIRFAPDRVWRQLHHLASDASVLLTGLHVAVHWRWVVNALRRVVGGSRATQERRAVSQEAS